MCVCLFFTFAQLAQVEARGVVMYVYGLEDDLTLIILDFEVSTIEVLSYLATPATMKKIDKRRLDELDSSTLVELIKDYMKENQELRRENMDLFSVRDMMLRDQELVCRENERLLKKLEDVNS